MIVAVPRESCPGERRVALIPASIAPLAKAGIEVLVQSGAGVLAGHSDQQYVDKGARSSPRATTFLPPTSCSKSGRPARMRRPVPPICPFTAGARW